MTVPMAARTDRCVTTFSIVGFDPQTGDLGVAVQSKFLAVGAVVPWARAGVGAVATQSWANTSYGPRGLDLLASGMSPADAIRSLTADDAQASQRQIGIVDASGRSATYTGEGCFDWAGGMCGRNFAAQGNILVGEETIRAMAENFEQSTGALWHRLVTALDAGQRAGGDKRGQQSAALVVVRAGGGYGGFNDRLMDLRVDDAPAPIAELARLVDYYELLFLRPRPDDLLPIEGERAREVQWLLRASGDYSGEVDGQFDRATYDALERFGARENLEERLLHDPADARIDRRVLDFLRGRAAESTPIREGERDAR